MKTICKLLFLVVLLATSSVFVVQAKPPPPPVPQSISSPTYPEGFDYWLREGQSVGWYTPPPGGTFYCTIWQLVFRSILAGLPGYPDEAWVALYKFQDGIPIFQADETVPEYGYITEQQPTGWPEVRFYTDHWLEVKSTTGKYPGCSVAWDYNIVFPFVPNNGQGMFSSGMSEGGISTESMDGAYPAPQN